MASIERYRPVREGYQPPSLPAARPPPAGVSTSTSSTSSTAPAAVPVPPSELHPQAISTLRQREVPPAVPSPPTQSLRTSPPMRLGPPTPRNGASSPAAGPPLASQWYFTEDEMECTPSVLHGLSPSEEQMRRAKGVNFIYQSGIAVQPHSLPQITLYVAAVFFHRFYMRVSMVEEHGGIHHYKIAATALFLANKTEENCFKTKSLIIAVAKTAQKNFNLIVDEQSKEYWRWRDSILTYEEYMLEMLTFDLVVANPYHQLWAQLRRLGQLPSKPIREASWTFLNDSALTTLPLLLDARDIASAAIFFASVASGEKIDDVHAEPWWQFLGANQDRITRAIQIMATFYTENPLRKQNGIQGSPVFSLETTRRPHELPPPPNNSSTTPLDGVPGRDSREVTPMELDRHTASQSQPSQPEEARKAGTAPVVVVAPAPAAVISTSQASTSQADSDTAVLSQTVSGESDACLKAAANDLSRHHHQHPPTYLNGTSDSQSFSSDKKRKSVDPEDEAADLKNGDGPRSKRSKQADEA